MLQERGERASGEHEQAQFAGFHEVFRPVATQTFQRSPFVASRDHLAHALCAPRAIRLAMDHCLHVPWDSGLQNLLHGRRWKIVSCCGFAQDKKPARRPGR